MPLGNGKKTRFCFFLPREARFCIHERHACAFARGTAVSLSKREKIYFLFFSFRKRHGFASARGTVVLLREACPCLFRKEKKKRASGSVFPSGFFHKFFLSKPINMGFIFEDLDAKNQMVKTVRDLDARFKRYNILNKWMYEKKLTGYDKLRACNASFVAT